MQAVAAASLALAQAVAAASLALAQPAGCSSACRCLLGARSTLQHLAAPWHRAGRSRRCRMAQLGGSRISRMYPIGACSS
jgi:hypothetical protein